MDLTKINLKTYLKNIGKDRYGTCISCNLQVYASRDRVASHKRRNCKNASKEEIESFEGVSNGISTNIELTQSRSIENKFYKITKGDETFIDKKIARFFFRTSSSFRLIESDAFKEMVYSLNPAYGPRLKTAKTLAGPQLNEHYTNLKNILEDKIKKSFGYVLISDGWTNIRFEHIINFIIILPGEPPMFYKSVDTSLMTLDKNQIAKLIIQVAKDIDVDKWIGLVVDNANVMQSSCDVIEKEFPKVFAKWCLAHGLNLFMKNVVQNENIKKLFESCNKIVKFINNHNKVYHFYTKNIRPSYNIKIGLYLPIETRFYTYFTHANSILENKTGLRHLIEEEEEKVCSMIAKSELYDNFKEIIADSIFWKNLKFLCEKILGPAKEHISKFEADDATLDSVYTSYLKLYYHYKNLDLNNLINNDIIGNLLLQDWNYMHTACMGFAHILAPKNFGTEIIENDYEDTLIQLNDYIKIFYEDQNDAEKCYAELEQFNLQYANADKKKKDFYIKKNSKAYWAMDRNCKFPLLAKIAQRTYMLPTSSAASERSWSIYGFIVSKVRNRLKPETQEKLVFTYSNSAYLDENDQKDYLDDDDFSIISEEENIPIDVIEL